MQVWTHFFLLGKWLVTNHPVHSFQQRQTAQKRPQKDHQHRPLCLQILLDHLDIGIKNNLVLKTKVKWFPLGQIKKTPNEKAQKVNPGTKKLEFQM